MRLPSHIIRIAAVAAAALFVVAPQASSKTAASPHLYLKIAGYRASVDMSPAGTLMNDDCTTYCGFAFPPGTTSVTLTARPAPGTWFVGWVQAFNGWTPPCSGNSPICQIDLSSSVAVKAAFSAVSLTLSSSSGGSANFLDSRPSCGSGCQLYAYDSVANVEASASDGYAFSGWSRFCGSYQSCALRMIANAAMSAGFACTGEICSISQPISNPIRVTVQVVGHGRVLGSHFDCPAVACSRDVERGQMLSIQAAPGAGAQFQGWYLRGITCSTRAASCTFPAFMDSRGASPRLVAYFT